MITARQLLGKLPPFTDTWVTVKENQRVKDIIKQIIKAHDKYAPYYDKIALYFDAPTIQGICNKLYDFIKKEIKYNEEPEHDQTTALPTGILHRGYGDCKHYASFIGGVLDALQRLTGKEIDWCYRFVSYKTLSQTPHHVFVVVFDGDTEYWIDPVPGANNLEPVWMLDKKVSMPLRDNIGSVFSADYNGDYSELYSNENTIGAAIQLPQYVNLLADKFQLVQTQSDIEENNKIIAIAKADHERYTPTLGKDQDLTTFLWLLKLSIMSKFGIKVKPLWDGGGQFLSDKWQYDFSPWLKQYYLKEWNLYLEAWDKYRDYNIKVIVDKWTPIINKGMSIVDDLFEQVGIDLNIPQLPTSPQLPTLPSGNTNATEPIMIAAVASVITYVVTKKVSIAGIVGIGAYLILKKQAATSPVVYPTTPTSPTSPTIKPADGSWTDWLKNIFSNSSSSSSDSGSAENEVFV